MTPDQIAEMITDDPDVFDEGFGKKFVGIGGALTLSALGLLGTGGGRPKPSIKVPARYAQEDPSVATTEPEEREVRAVQVSEPAKPKPPKPLQKPPASGSEKDALDRLWKLVAMSIGKGEDELVKNDFVTVLNLYARGYGGGKIDKRVVDVILKDAGFSRGVRLAAPVKIFGQLDKNEDGVLQMGEITKIFFR